MLPPEGKKVAINYSGRNIPAQHYIQAGMHELQSVLPGEFLF